MRSLKSYRGKCKDANTVKADSCCLEKRPLYFFFSRLFRPGPPVSARFLRLRMPSRLLNRLLRSLIDWSTDARVEHGERRGHGGRAQVNGSGDPCWPRRHGGLPVSPRHLRTVQSGGTSLRVNTIMYNLRSSPSASRFIRSLALSFGVKPYCDLGAGASQHRKGKRNRSTRYGESRDKSTTNKSFPIYTH